MWAKYNSSVAWTHFFFLPYCSLGTRRKVQCSAADTLWSCVCMIKPFKKQKEKIHVNVWVSHWEIKDVTNMIDRSDFLCDTMLLNSSVRLSIKSWKILNRWFLLANIFPFPKLKVRLVFYVCWVCCFLLLWYNKYLHLYLNSQSKIITDVWKGDQRYQKFNKHEMRSALIWGMPEKKSSTNILFKFILEFLS